jgi:hypothetical protein
MDASDGTSQASPTFAGILALATQLRRTDLGTVNPALYAIGPRGTAAGIIDVPAGYTDSAYGVTGFATAAGYDIASDCGTAGRGARRAVRRGGGHLAPRRCDLQYLAD